VPGFRTPLPALPGSLGLERRFAAYQGLGKGWLLAFPRLPDALALQGPSRFWEFLLLWAVKKDAHGRDVHRQLQDNLAKS